MIVDEAEAVLLGLQPESKPLQPGSKDLPQTSNSSTGLAAALEDVTQEEEEEEEGRGGEEVDETKTGKSERAHGEQHSSSNMIRLLEDYMSKREEPLEEKCALHRGMAITEQLACVQAFRRGRFHVLVSTQV